MTHSFGMIIAGLSSRSGKTTVTLALLAALRRAGVALAPFKAGPDYIDPSWHQSIANTPSYNLDTLMVGVPECQRLLATHGANRVVVVEGVMGLFDGREGVGGVGSTADLARQLGLPVVLAIEARGLSGSIAPLVAGCVHYAHGFNIVGVIANQVGGASHAQRLTTVLQEQKLPPLLGWLPRDPKLALPERHLGLVLPNTSLGLDSDDLANALHLELPALLNATQWLPPSVTPAIAPPLLAGRTIGVARDAAFCFIYPANLEWLLAMGATVRFFSPLAGESAPVDAQALWLPGGYPELYAPRLAASPTWESLHRLAARNIPILAECGGMMALGHTLVDHQGQAWPMANLIPVVTRMTDRLAGLGYRLEQGGARGHEFHHSTRDAAELPPAFVVDRGDPGLQIGSLRASYIHWYFPSAPTVCAQWFLP